MKPIVGIFLTALALGAASLATAQSQIVGVSPSKRQQIDVYSKPDTKTPPRQIKTVDLVFPLAVHEIKAGFLSVTIDGQARWLRNVQVQVKQGSTAGCPPAIALLDSSISTPGAGSTNCK